MQRGLPNLLARDAAQVEKHRAARPLGAVIVAKRIFRTNIFVAHFRPHPRNRMHARTQRTARDTCAITAVVPNDPRLRWLEGLGRRADRNAANAVARAVLRLSRSFVSSHRVTLPVVSIAWFGNAVALVILTPRLGSYQTMHSAIDAIDAITVNARGATGARAIRRPVPDEQQTIFDRRR